MPIAFYRSTVGKKVIVAVTGLLMFGFVIGHLLGNLQIFEGPEKLNAYAAFLKHAKPLLWGTRLVLLVAVFLHFFITIDLARRNRASRPVGYAQHRMIQASIPSRFMIWSGLFLAFYIPFHILHLTVPVVMSASYSEIDVYANVIAGFSQWPISAIYMLAMISLGMHLYHGVFSLFQTLGLNHPKYNGWRRGLAIGSAWVIAAGYISIPLAVLLGILHR